MLGRKRLVRYLLVLSLCLVGLPARADPAFTADHATISGGVRWATENLDLGVGVRGGYTLDMGVYLGAGFDYWFGEKEEQAVPPPVGGTISAEAHGWDLMGEVGYDIGVAPTIVIRPFGGLGVFHAEGEICSPFFGCQEISDSEAAFEFGGLAVFGFDGLNVVPELRVLIADEAAVLFGGSIGADF